MIKLLKKIFLIALCLSITTPDCVLAKKKTTINLRNKGIEDVGVLSFRSGIKKIVLAENLITDLSPLLLPETLRSLNLFGNQIENASSLALPEGLTFLELGDNKIADINGLLLPSTIKEFNLSFNQISDEGIRNIILPQSLEEINLATNQIQDPRSINYPANLKILNLFDNRIAFSDENGNDLEVFKGLVLPDTLEVLNLGDNSVGENDWNDLVLPPNLKSLNLSSNPIADLRDLNYPDSLEDLNLFLCRIIDASKVKVPTNLKKLDLSFNNLANFSSFPVMPETLRVIDLQETGLGDIDVDDLIRVLPRKMKRINLTNNGFSKSAKKKLRRAFPRAKIKFGFEDI